MMGYGMSWASFASIEVMSSSRFAHKRIAYLAATQGFTQDTDVILLTTNLLKKELRGGVYEAGLAINCIANIVTEDLARDLLPEITSLTQHPQPYLRKKAVLCLFKLFVKYPQGLRLSFPNIQLCLEDTNNSVVSCAVCVVTELSDKNPKNYLHLAPSFFQLLTTSSNNWMLIKVVKLLGSLVPEEPRLARKLLEPLSDIVRNTKAKSLLYEAVHTITLCLPYCRRSDGTMPAIVPEIVALCSETLQGFVNESDQNLKYLGLVGFGSLMQSHPRVLSAPGYRPIILACLSDQDITIRTRALSLLSGMASRKNLRELVTQLLKHVELATGSYKLDLVSKIVEMCTTEKYAPLADFTWYLNVLFQLGHMRGLDAHSSLLRSQISDVALRVLPVRALAVRRSMGIVLEREGVPSSEDPYGDNGRGRQIIPEILPAIAWIVGEYSDLIRDSLDAVGEVLLEDDKSAGIFHSIIQAFTSSSNVTRFPPETQQVYLQAALKVFAAATADPKVPDKELVASCETLKESLPLYMQSTDVEVQERAFTAHALLMSMGLISGHKSVPVLASVGSEDGDDDGARNARSEGDLLGMNAGLPATKSPKEMTALSGSQGKQDVAAKCRQSSAALNYVLKPSPMKPSSAKSQRKKSRSPIGIDGNELTHVDYGVFTSLVADELSLSSVSRFSLESVSFTQQKSVRPVEKTPMSTNTQCSDSMGTSPLMYPGGATTFQNSRGADPYENTGSTSRPTQNDPFYLHSAPKANESDGRDIGQFGMIQLSDSDENGAEATKKRKKKMKKAPVASGVTVYDSDESDSGLRHAPTHTKSAAKKRPGKEFASLAKVDLTEPLREDEVMPERKHRVVPETPMTTQNESKKGKKDKKESKKKRKKEKKMHYAPENAGSNVGDLLQLGGFSGAASALVNSGSDLPTTGLPAQGTRNAISDAFEDLLGLQTPTLAPQIPDFTSPAQSAPSVFSQETGNSPWINASVKLSKNLKAAPNVDLSSVSVQFKVARATQTHGTAAMTKVRVANTSTVALRNVSISIGGVFLSFGDIKPSVFQESHEFGPVSYGEVDVGCDLKGTFAVSDCSLSVKLCMPVSLYLSPWNGLTLEDVSNSLSSPSLDSRSITIKFPASTHPQSIKHILLSYLHAAEVNADGADSLATCALAAQSLGGVRLLVLLKVKQGVAKIDLKSTHRGFSKALASDLKKIIL